jgi:hypothetical protein
MYGPELFKDALQEITKRKYPHKTQGHLDSQTIRFAAPIWSLNHASEQLDEDSLGLEHYEILYYGLINDCLKIVKEAPIHPNATKTLIRYLYMSLIKPCLQPCMELLSELPEWLKLEESSSPSMEPPKAENKRLDNSKLLLEYTLAGEIKQVRELLQATTPGIDIDLRYEGKHKRNALAIAIANRNAKMITALLEKVPDCLENAFDIDAYFPGTKETLAGVAETNINIELVESVLWPYSNKILENEEEMAATELDAAEEEESNLATANPHNLDIPPSLSGKPGQKRPVIWAEPPPITEVRYAERQTNWF